jgi:hypothetical protein
MYWDCRPFLKDRNKELARDLLNPYGPCFRALQLLGCDGHADSTNEQQIEWLVKFNKKANAMEKAAAYLTMLLSLRGQTGLAEAFLKKVESKAALFKTEMDVIFPVEWKLYRRRGGAGGGFDSKPTRVTVIDFYEEGLKRGYDTKTKIKAIRDNFGSYLPTKPSTQKTPAPANSNTTSTPADKASASGDSSRGRGTPGGGGAPPSQKKPDPASNTSSQKKPQTQSHIPPQAQTQKNQGHGNQGQASQGHGKPQAQSQT